MEKLTVGSCFSGIGGLELGLERTGGFETKWQIENDDYASAILAKHWPGVKRYADIRTVSFPERVDVVCGGFPCQDVSLAGARKGLEGKRSTLWGEMFRLVCEVKPHWVVAENVPGLLSSDDGRFFGNILRDLASAGYDAEWGVLSARGMGALHLRRRVFILAYPNDSARSPERELEQSERAEVIRGSGEAFSNTESHKRRLSNGDGQDVIPHTESEQSGGGIVQRLLPDTGTVRQIPDSNLKRLEGERPDGGEEGWKDPKRPIGLPSGAIRHPSSEGLPNWSGGTVGQPSPLTEFERPSGREIERDICGVAYGVSHRVHRLKCLGNAVVPQVAQKIGEMILNSIQGEL